MVKHHITYEFKRTVIIAQDTKEVILNIHYVSCVCVNWEQLRCFTHGDKEKEKGSFVF